MLKHFITLILFVVFHDISFAQNHSAEAKAAYLLAEEEFNTGKYESAISYLNQASEKLGAPNAKILYLKILALQPLAQKDAMQLAALTEAIDAFEKAPDIESFNEEKKLEVYKLKLRNARLLEAMPKNTLELAALKEMKITGWKLGMKLSGLQEAESAFFTSAQKITVGETDQYHGVYRQTSGISVYIKKGVLVQLNFSPPGQSTSDAAKNISLSNEIKMKLGADPKDTTITKVDGYKKVFTTTTKIRTLTWNNQNVRIELSQTDMIWKDKKETKHYNYLLLSLIDDSLQ